MARAGGLPPGRSGDDLRPGLVERARLEWRLGEPGDPAALVEGFLAAHGLTLTHDHSPAGSQAAALIHVSAAACAAMIGAPVGAPSPVSALPDVVVVAYHAGSVSGSGHAPDSGAVGPSVGASKSSGGASRSSDGASEASGGASGPPDAPSLARYIGNVGWVESGEGQEGALGWPGAVLPGAAPEADRAIPGETEPDTPPEPAGEWWLGEWRPSWSPAAHAKAVEAVRDAIAAGDVYQVNVVGHASAPYAGDPRPALRRVATLPGARYPVVLEGAGWALACASPETLVSVREGRISTKPIKGTRPATERGRAELLTSEKERAEHIMIVDLARNDIAHVARVGSVAVDELYAIRRWSDLWQAESVVTADLRPGVGVADVLRALCPGGSVTGAPKLAALREIAGLEPVGRGPSMGALGWIDASGLDLGLTIRTVVADAERIHLWAGGGITWSSDPWDEVAEAAAKAAPIRALLAG